MRVINFSVDYAKLKRAVDNDSKEIAHRRYIISVSAFCGLGLRIETDGRRPFVWTVGAAHFESRNADKSSQQWSSLVQTLCPAYTYYVCYILTI